MVGKPGWSCGDRKKPCHSSSSGGGTRQAAHMEKLSWLGAASGLAGMRHCGAAACLEAPHVWEHVLAHCLR